MQTNKATWIWYPGDFEIRLHEKMSVKRKAREGSYPAYWRLDRHYSNIKFRFTYDLPHEEQISIASEGLCAVYLDGKDNIRSGHSIMTLPAGRHEIMVTVFNDTEAPALFVQGEHIVSDSSWEVTSYQNEWLPAASWIFDDIEQPPSQFRLEVTPQEPISCELRNGHQLLDFGKETFGYLQFHQLTGEGKLTISYGESIEEALSPEHCVMIDELHVNPALVSEDDTYTAEEARAFRYVWIHGDSGIQWERISMLYEYVPVDYRGSFESSNARLNEIYEKSLYTFHLNTREFFLDGIKRDRWVWSGDAYQSFLMNYYSFFDQDVARRTLIALRGKDPLTMHINTILDYSFYWFISLNDYYLYTGDLAFISQNYDRAVTLMDFCLKQCNEEGLVVGRPQDWVFVDWADFSNEGAVSTEQILLAKALEAMKLFASLMGDDTLASHYGVIAEELITKTITLFWDEEQGGLRHHRVNGETLPQLTKHANMFALTFNYLTPEQRENVIQNVMLNPGVSPIRTPYMRFHELAVLCESGEHEFVLNEMLAYWGGMLDLGATTFWEEYDPSVTGLKHYEMYEMPYGKSLCHAWGASPLYIVGKYFLGVKPLETGYKAFVVEPKLGGLEWIRGSVPLPQGQVDVKMSIDSISVRATAGHGKLRYEKDGEIKELEIPRDGSWLEVTL